MYEYTAKIDGVHDGDTCTATVDLGFCASIQLHLRLIGINAPELSQPTGPAARDHLKAMIDGKTVMVKTQKDKQEKYGRYLATIFVGDDPTSVNERMISAGHAVAWDGKGPRP